MTMKISSTGKNGTIWKKLHPCVSGAMKSCVCSTDWFLQRVSHSSGVEDIQLFKLIDLSCQTAVTSCFHCYLLFTALCWIFVCVFLLCALMCVISSRTVIVPTPHPQVLLLPCYQNKVCLPSKDKLKEIDMWALVRNRYTDLLEPCSHRDISKMSHQLPRVCSRQPLEDSPSFFYPLCQEIVPYSQDAEC